MLFLMLKFIGKQITLKAFSLIYLHRNQFIKLEKKFYKEYGKSSHKLRNSCVGGINIPYFISWLGFMESNGKKKPSDFQLAPSEFVM